MNNEYAKVFSNAFLNVMPQLGITDVTLQNEEECDHQINATGAVCIIGIVGELHGNVIFSMGEECAKNIASGMMCGMEVPEFDEMAQSAICELSNMLAANACMELSVMGANVDISTPTLMYGVFSVSASFERVIRLDMLVNNLPFHIYVSLEKK